MSSETKESIRDALALRNSMGRLIDETFLRPSSEWLAAFRDRPAMDVYETDEAVNVEMHLPGIKREEIEIDLKGTTLTVKGERKADRELKEDHFIRREVHYGTFMRSVTLPEVIDAAQASAIFADGVLKISFPKTAEVQPMRIEIKPEEVAV